MKIAKKLENIQYQFLWADEDGRRIYHPMKWDDVKSSLEQGGLGEAGRFGL